MNLEIRRATEAEAETVSEILLEAAAWLRDCGHPLWRPEQLGALQVAPDCAAGFYFVAWNQHAAGGGSAAGTMRLTDSDPDFWPEAVEGEGEGEAIYLHRLAVRRESAGGRVSTELFRHAARIATERGARLLRLDCESNRPRLRNVYERFGFEYQSDHTVRGVHVARYEFDCSEVGE